MIEAFKMYSHSIFESANDEIIGSLIMRTKRSITYKKKIIFVILILFKSLLGAFLMLVPSYHRSNSIEFHSQ